MVLRGILGPKGEKVVEGWRKLQNEELHNLNASVNITVMTSRRI
jgi:hypothetical protein